MNFTLINILIHSGCCLTRNESRRLLFHNSVLLQKGKINRRIIIAEEAIFINDVDELTEDIEVGNVLIVGKRKFVLDKTIFDKLFFNKNNK